MPGLLPASNDHDPIGVASEGLWTLYVRLSAWLIPSFLVFALAGLTLLANIAVQEVDRKLSMRVGNFAARVASGLETVAYDPGHALEAGQQIILTLMSDPAVECAELRDLDGQTILAAPQGLGCHSGVGNRNLTVPIYFTSDADLVVYWNRNEVVDARQRQRELSMIILLAGLMIALLTNWLAFRTIIGRPLGDLVEKVDKARFQAEYNALHDSLTGLANRRLLDEELARRSKHRQPLTVLHIDLDGFKAINDALGHGAGDEILQEVAERLRRSSGQQELVARNGGDEFVILMPPDAGPETARLRANEIIQSVQDDIEIQGEACRVGASIGIASGVPHGNSEHASRIVANADIALYKAKANGRGTYALYTPDLRESLEQRRRLADEIQLALERDEFVAYFQPQTARDARTVVGLEALARWQHPRAGLLGPEKFISAAEEMGLVDQIDRMVLDCALRAIEAWGAEGFEAPRISVNVSARRLYSTKLLEELRSKNLPRNRIVFEVLESVVIDGSNSTLAWNLDGLRDMGIDLELDDFGTGRASIASILALRPSYIKVAREIIQASDSAGPHTGLLEATAALGRELGVGLVAEGVETPAQIEMAISHGFDRLQGYAIAHPMPFSDVLTWIRNRNLKIG